MKRSKGFTLVELVIVIAVIAILAGVMIGVFSNVVKEAKKSAELQQMKNEELAQKADDVLKSVENADWLSWTEFEETLSTKLAEQTTNNQTFYTAAIQDALEQFIAKAAENNTGLTEDQVKYIVENAVAGKSTLTEDQVKSIVNAAVATSTSGLSTLTKAQVQSIVDIAQAKNLTAAQVKTVVDQCIDGKVPTDEDIAAIVRANTLTEAQITALLEATLPVTKKVTTSDNLSNIAAALNSGSTIMFTGDWSNATATVNFSANKTLYFRGSDVGTLTINAPAATIGVYNKVTNLNVTAIAMASLHLYGEVGTLNMEQGRAVLEAGATVAEVNVAPKAPAASVELVVAPKVTLPTLTVDTLTGGSSVTVENKGTIAAVEVKGTTVPVEIKTTETGTTPVIEGDNVVTDNKGAVSIANFDNVTSFTNGKTYKLSQNITLEASVTIDKTVVIDLNGFTVTAHTGLAAFINNGGNVTFKGNGTVIGANLIEADSDNRGVITTKNGGITTVKDGTYKMSTKGDKTNTAVFFVGDVSSADSTTDYGTLVFDGGTVCATGYEVKKAGSYEGVPCIMEVTSYKQGVSAADDKKATVTINGGTFTSDGYVLRGSGNDNSAGTFTTINGGSLTSAYTTCIYHAQTGTIILNGGTIKGTSGLELKGGIATATTSFAMNGGKVVATGATKTELDTDSTGTDGYVDAIAIIYSPAYAKPANVTIAGGMFTSANGKAIASYYYSSEAIDTQGSEVSFTISGDYPCVYEWVNDVPVAVTGGTFSSDVSAYCAGGYSYDATTGMVTED